MDYSKRFDVIVIGGGHAGTEAALAAARMGVQTLLLTHNLETVGVMSCNPAIGGIGKSHLVREIDALDGAMARATDRAGIQFRVLNRRKGPAVRATRAQADRALYRAAIHQIIAAQPNLSVFQQACDDFLIEGERVTGVVTQTGIVIRARAVVLTSGTFLSGVVHVGLNSYRGGRAGDPPALALAQRLRALPLRVGRLKTGTPARIDARSVDFSVMQVQPGDTPLPVMSFLGTQAEHPQQVNCYITHTNERTHEIIRQALDRSPLYAGVISGVGPRYCPSIEDKIVRFADKNSHQIFVEPEGLSSFELYPNGISTSLPFDVQVAMIQSIQGFEQAHLTRPGYAIEYDFCNPQDLSHALESRFIQGLFLAGQINGTTGYEEAGAQGLLAGANAALQVLQKEPWIPMRDQSYLGVMVDDLISLGTLEPYRMFTSRAEYRLILREDNADLRLTEKGYELGLVGEARYRAFCEKREAIAQEHQRLASTWIQPQTPEAEIINTKIKNPIAHEYSLLDLLKRPELNYQDVAALKNLEAVSDQVAEQVMVAVKYAGYIDRQQEDIRQLKRHEAIALPEHFDYTQVGGLSNEMVSKLTQLRPKTLAAASRIPGVTPAALSQLLVFLKKRSAHAMSAVVVSDSE